MYSVNSNVYSYLSDTTVRLKNTYASTSQASYYNQFTMFLMFCNRLSISLQLLQVEHIIAFIEFLVNSNVTHATIVTYMSALKAIFNQFNLNIEILNHVNIALMLRACHRTLQFKPNTSRYYHHHCYKLLFRQLMPFHWG